MTSGGTEGADVAVARAPGAGEEVMTISGLPDIREFAGEPVTGAWPPCLHDMSAPSITAAIAAGSRLLFIERPPDGLLDVCQRVVVHQCPGAASESL